VINQQFAAGVLAALACVASVGIAWAWIRSRKRRLDRSFAWLQKQIDAERYERLRLGNRVAGLEHHAATPAPEGR